MSRTFTYTGSVTFPTAGDFVVVHSDTPPVCYQPVFMDCLLSEAPAGFWYCWLFADGGFGLVLGATGSPGETYTSVSGSVPIPASAPSCSIQLSPSAPQPVPWTVSYTIHVTYSDCDEPLTAAMPSRLATIVG